MNFSSITSSLTQSAKSMNSLATKIGTHLQNQFGPTIDSIKDSLDVLKAGQDMVSTVVHDVTGQNINIRSIQKGAADFDEKWDAFVKEINSKFNTASPNGQADIMETFVKSHFGDDVYNLGSAIKNELPNVLDGIADYQETINSISSNSKTVEEAATKINNSVEKMVKATEKIASSINNAVEICTGKGIPVLDELSKIGSSADVVNLNKALNIGMVGAQAVTATNQLKQSIKNKDLQGITDAMAKGATSVNSLMSQLQQIVPGFPNAQIPVKITDSIKRLQNAQSVYDAAGSMVTALVADASGRHDLSSFATLASNFNQNWDTFSSKIDALFNIVPANGQQAVLETLAKNMFGENVFYAAGAIKRQTPGFLSGLAGVQDAIKQLGGSYRNPIEAVTKIRNCTEKIVQSVEKIGQSLNNMVKYYQGKVDITKGTGYPLLEMMGNLGDTKGIKALDYVLRTAGGTAAIVGNAGAVAQAIKNKDIPGAIAAVKKTIDDFKNLTKKGNYKAQGNDKGALPNNDNNKSSSPPNEQQEKQKIQLSSGQTDSYVCSGATMRCTMGTSQAKLTVLPTRTVYLTGQPMANISDHLSMINLSPFGNCRSMGFPATAAATAANYGTLTPQPCMHNTPFPWMSGKNDYIIKGDPALLKSSTCQCMWGGTISINDDGQHGEGTQWVQKQARENYLNREFTLQTLGFDCGIKSSLLVLHSYGKFLEGTEKGNERKLVELASSMRIFNNNISKDDLEIVLSRLLVSKGKNLTNEEIKELAEKEEKGIYPKEESLNKLLEILGISESNLKIEIAKIVDMEIFSKKPNTLDNLPKEDLRKLLEIFGRELLNYETTDIEEIMMYKDVSTKLRKNALDYYLHHGKSEKDALSMAEDEVLRLTKWSNERWYGGRDVGGIRQFALKEILNWAGLETKETHNATIEELERELNIGHHVIVQLDSKELWYDLYNDEIMGSNPDHFLVINKIENGKVILTDSGKGDFMKEYDIEKFKESWNDSNNFMLISPKTGTYHQDENIANKWCEIKEGEIVKGKCSIIPVGKFSL